VESQIDAVYWPGDPWHTMRRGLTASNPDATLRMELNALQSALDYAFHIRSDSSDGGQTAAIELIVNSNTYPLKNIGTDNDYFWHIPNNLLITGTNTFTMHYAAGPAAYITFDWMELGGSWQVGTNDNSKEEFIVEGSAPDDFYVTNPNWKHLERALTAGDPEIDIHFTLSPEMIAKYTYLYTTRVIEQESGHPHPFTIGCNDTVIQTYPDNGLPNGTLVSIPIPPELLLPGDNAINLIYTGSSSYMQFDFHRLDLKKFPSGTIILIR
jgi:hypothetical protein